MRLINWLTNGYRIMTDFVALVVTFCSFNRLLIIQRPQFSLQY